jgi:hypothetical protein
MMRMSAFVADKGAARLPMLYDACRFAIGRSPVSIRGIRGFESGRKSADAAESGTRDDDIVGTTSKRQRMQTVSCRRAIIAAAFGELPPRRIDPKASESEMQGLLQEGYGLVSDCCDLCADAATCSGMVPLDVTEEAASVVRIIRHHNKKFPEKKLTLNRLVTDWSNTGAKGRELRGDEPAAGRHLGKAVRLEILLNAVLESVLREYFVYGMYSMHGYVTVGDAGVACERGLVRVTIDVPVDSSLLKQV